MASMSFAALGSGVGEYDVREVAGWMIVVAWRLAILSVDGETLRMRDLNRVRFISSAFVAAS